MILADSPRGRRSRPTVYGRRGPEDGLDRLLDETARVQHPDAGAHLRDHTDGVADEEHGRRSSAWSRARNRAPSASPSRRARSWPVEDEKLRVLGECHCNHDALLHPAGELVWIAAQDAAGSAICTCPSISSARALPPSRAPRDGEHLAPVADVQRRAQGSLGSLDHRHRPRGTDAAHLPSVQDVSPSPDRPLRDSTVPRQVADDSECAVDLPQPDSPTSP